MSETTVTDSAAADTDEETPEADSEDPAPDGETQETETSRSFDSLQSFASHDSDHLELTAVAALLAAGIGVIASQPGLLLVAVVAVGLLALRRAAADPVPKLAVSRSLSTETPDPDDVVTVETTVTNVGESTLTDCRLIDLVPDEAVVVDGSPRMAVALRPGGSETIAYDIRVQRGRHTFEGVYTIVSNFVGTTEHEYQIEAVDEFTCRPEPEPLQMPVLRQLTTPYAGRLTTEKPGEGLEFHSVREYRRGDSLRRIDWNQYASTGELATLQFRTERSASVVLLADVRPGAYVRADDDSQHAVDRGLEAIGRLFVTLLDEDHRAGIATLGPDFWLAPGDGTEHRSRVLEALGSSPALSPSASTEEFPIRLRTHRLLERFSELSQVIVCTPLVDDQPEIAIQILESAGHDVTVISPDPTGRETPGQVVGELERDQRISRIHEFGVPVIDWPPDERLDTVIARTVSGWSA